MAESLITQSLTNPDLSGIAGSASAILPVSYTAASIKNEEIVFFSSESFSYAVVLLTQMRPFGNNGNSCSCTYPTIVTPYSSFFSFASRVSNYDSSSLYILNSTKYGCWGEYADGILSVKLRPYINEMMGGTPFSDPICLGFVLFFTWDQKRRSLRSFFFLRFPVRIEQTKVPALSMILSTILQSLRDGCNCD